MRVAGTIMAMALASATAVVFTQTASPGTIAIVGTTLIDGRGGAPVPDTTVIVADGKIASVGSTSSVRPPAGATVIDGKRQVRHARLRRHQRPPLALRRHGRSLRDAGEVSPAAEARSCSKPRRCELKYGVTTVRDSYGVLMPLVAVRDDIAAGRAIGPRILAAGNIVGWGGPYSVSFSLIREQGLTLFQEQVNDEISQGAGEDLRRHGRRRNCAPRSAPIWTRGRTSSSTAAPRTSRDRRSSASRRRRRR